MCHINDNSVFDGILLYKYGLRGFFEKHEENILRTDSIQAGGISSFVSIEISSGRNFHYKNKTRAEYYTYIQVSTKGCLYIFRWQARLIARLSEIIISGM